MDRGRASQCTVLAVGLVCSLLTAGCRDLASPEGDRNPAKAKIRVGAVNYPLAYFARRIGGEQVEVHFSVPESDDPAFWKPNVDEIGIFQEADLILLNGADFAKWTGHVSLPRSKTVNTTAEVQEKYIQVQESIAHQHGPEGEHSHQGLAFTTWLDFQIAIAQARSVKNALCDQMPNSVPSFEGRFEDLEEELNALDEQLASVVAGQKNRPLFGSHPVYQYLRQAYGLNLQALHWEPREMPDVEAWEAFDKLLVQHPAKVMLWEASPLPEIQEKLTQKGVISIVYSPASNTPRDADFLEVMRQNVARLHKALE
ncbi:MAG: metal ABC transporter substrate-binding protein [Planctomycetota bacterium]